MNKIRIGLLIIIISMSTSQNYSQVSQEWVARYSGPVNVDIPYSIAVDDSGNVYVTGQSAGSGSNYDYVTIKYNSSGIQQWFQRYNGTGNSTDNAFSVVVDDFHNVYVTGRSWGIGSAFDYATIKYSMSGDLQWVQRYDGDVNDNDEAKAIAVDHSGNVYVTGYSWGIYSDYATIKYSSSGVQQWVRRYNNPPDGSDLAYSITIDNFGNVYVAGGSYLQGTGYDYAMVKYNSSGTEQWIRRYNGPANADDISISVKVDFSGNVYETGYSYGSGSGIDYATVKYNSGGVEQWVQRYNGPPGNLSDYARAIVIDSSGNVYVTGESSGSGSSYDYATIKYNTSGVQQWVQRYNAPENSSDKACCITVDELENVYVTGTTLPGSGTDENYTSIKYNPSGNQLWVEVYNGPGSSSSFDITHGIAIDKMGNVYVTGESDGVGTSRDYATIKYSQTIIGINPNSHNLPGKFLLEQNYPNPFNPSTFIRYTLIENDFVTLKVYDVLGNEIATLVNEEQSRGNYNYQLSAVNFQLSSGIYYYRLESGSFSEVRKMILLK